MRTWRYEFLSTATILAIPVAVALAIPAEALRFRPADVSSACSASAAFITLTPEEEEKALVAAKTVWQSEASADRRVRIRLPLGELPEEKEGPLLDVGAGVRPSESPQPIRYAPSAWEPSQRAEAPVRFVSAPERRPAPAFSREELLKIN